MMTSVMQNKDVVQIFLPSQCMEMPSGALLGQWSKDNKVCCITGLATELHSAELSKVSHDILQHRVVGVWHNDTDSHTVVQEVNSQCEGGLILKRSDAGMPTCYLPSSKCRPIIILLGDILSSQYLIEKIIASQYKDCIASTSFTPKSQTTEPSTSCINFITSTFISTCDIQNTDRNVINFSEPHRENILKTKAYHSENSDHSWLTAVCQFEYGRNWWPASIQQAQLKISAWKNIVNCNVTSHLRWQNSLSKQMFDVVVGLIITYLLTTTEAASLPSSIMQNTEMVANELQRLLHWLMGVPAGLKLNSQMAQFLGRFFLYHIYLWTGFLHLLRPILFASRWIVAMAGILGLSMQISLLRDLLTLMTLHIYCFYVYAARLYFLQVTCMGSLWRLFRGKKWNVLRQRVDSTSYDVDQLFIGTLLFTILLFLMPTTALFYIVHMAVHLLVLIMQGVLNHMVLLLNNLPVYIIYLRLLHPSALAEDVRLEVVKSSADRPLCLSLQLIPAGLVTICREFWEENTRGRYLWGELVRMLLRGQLVYPWVESTILKRQLWKLNTTAATEQAEEND